MTPSTRKILLLLRNANVPALSSVLFHTKPTVDRRWRAINPQPSPSPAILRFLLDDGQRGGRPCGRPCGSDDGQSSSLPYSIAFVLLVRGEGAGMGKASHTYAGLDPATLKVVEEVLDEVWASLAPHLGRDGESTDAAQMRLANIVLDLAKDGHLSALQITRTAARLMRETAD